MEIAAGFIGLAAFGLQLTEILHKYVSSASGAEGSIKTILTSVTLLTSVLEHFRSCINDDSNRVNLSDLAVGMVQSALDQCKDLFVEVYSLLIEGPLPQPVLGLPPIDTSKLSFRKRIQFPLIEPRLEILLTNLERTKSSLVLLTLVFSLGDFTKTYPGAEKESTRRKQHIELLVEQHKVIVEKVESLQRRWDGELSGNQDSLASQKRNDSGLPDALPAKLHYSEMSDDAAKKTPTPTHKENELVENATGNGSSPQSSSVSPSGAKDTAPGIDESFQRMVAMSRTTLDRMEESSCVVSPVPQNVARQPRLQYSVESTPALRTLAVRLRQDYVAQLDLVMSMKELFEEGLREMFMPDWSGVSAMPRFAEPKPCIPLPKWLCLIEDLDIRARELLDCLACRKGCHGPYKTTLQTFANMDRTSTQATLSDNVGGVSPGEAVNYYHTSPLVEQCSENTSQTPDAGAPALGQQGFDDYASTSKSPMIVSASRDLDNVYTPGGQHHHNAHRPSLEGSRRLSLSAGWTRLRQRLSFTAHMKVELPAGPEDYHAALSQGTGSGIRGVDRVEAPWTRRRGRAVSFVGSPDPATSEQSTGSTNSDRSPRSERFSQVATDRTKPGVGTEVEMYAPANELNIQKIHGCGGSTLGVGPLPRAQDPNAESANAVISVDSILAASADELLARLTDYYDVVPVSSYSD